MGEAVHVPFTFGPITTELAFFVFRSSPYDFIVGRSCRKKIMASLDLNKALATFRHGEGTTHIPLVMERAAGRSSQAQEFRSEDCSDSSSGDDSDEKQD